MKPSLNNMLLPIDIYLFIYLIVPSLDRKTPPRESILSCYNSYIGLVSPKSFVCC